MLEAKIPERGNGRLKPLSLKEKQRNEAESRKRRFIPEILEESSVMLARNFCFRRDSCAALCLTLKRKAT
jgi:hypothetical protein